MLRIEVRHSAVSQFAWLYVVIMLVCASVRACVRFPTFLTPERHGSTSHQVHMIRMTFKGHWVKIDYMGIGCREEEEV